MVQYEDGLPVTGEIDEATLDDRRQQSPCIGTSAEGPVGVLEGDATSCDDAIARWARFVEQADGGGDTVVFDDGWSCNRLTPESDFAPAVAGSCAGPDSGFTVVAGWG